MKNPVEHLQNDQYSERWKKLSNGLHLNPQEGHFNSFRHFKYSSSWKAVAQSSKDAFWGWQFFLPLNAYMAAKEKPGERLASFAAETAGMATNALISPIVTAGLHAIPFFGALPSGARSMIGMFVADMAINQPLVQKMGYALRRAGSAVNRQRSLETGGNFIDSESAQASRIQAVQQMSSVFGASRRYLGQEARLLHG